MSDQYTYVRFWGCALQVGVHRKIVPLTRDHVGKDTGFELTDDYLRVVIPSRQAE